MKSLAGITATIGMMVAATLALTWLKLAGLTEVARWPWWAVAGPLWVPWALAVAAAAVLLAGLLGERGLQRMERWARGE